VRHVIPFHYSPRYAGEYARLNEELLQAFGSGERAVPAASGGH
jgi:hypothetical protein